MQKYRTYCKQLHNDYKGIVSSYSNKPLGGLWGCRDDAWKTWCENEEFHLDRLEQCFEWELKKGTKVLYINTIEDYINLCINYGNLDIRSVDYSKVAEDYDAIEMSDIVHQLRFGWMSIWHDTEIEKYLAMYKDHPMIRILYVGLSAWDVPSICVLKPNKVNFIGELICH